MKTPFISLLILLCLVPLPPARAATKTWAGGSNGYWASGPNWFGGTAPAAGDDLVFPAGATRFVVTNNFSPNRAFNSVTFLAPYTVYGQALVLTNGLRCGHSNSTVEIRAAITIAGTQSFFVTNGPATLLHLNTNLDLGAFGLTIGGNGKTEISSAIGGASGLVKNGTNILHFYGSTANTYAGATVVNAGTLQLNKNGVTAIAGQLFIGDGVGGTEADVVEVLSNEQIANNVAVQISSSGLLKCRSGALESIGPLTLTGGRTATSGAAATLILLNDVTVQASSSTAQMNGRVSFAGHRTFTVSNGSADPDLILGGNILEEVGSVNLLKNGPGTLYISGYSGLTGNTIIREGVLVAASSDPVGNTIVSNNAVLRVAGLSSYFPIVGFTLTLNGSGDGNGALQLTNGHSGWRGPVVLATHSTIGVFGDTNSFTIGAANGLISGPAGFTKIGDGILRITNGLASTFEGYVFVNAGRLELSNAPGAVAIPGDLFVGDGVGGEDDDVVRLLAGGQLSPFAPVTVNSSGWFDCTPIPNGQIQTIPSLTLNNGAHATVPSSSELHVSGTITATGGYQSRIDGGGYLVLAAANALINVTGSGEEINLRISPPEIAAGTVTKIGPGRLVLGPGYLATSSLRVAAGTLETTSPVALGHFVANPTVIVSNGATLHLTGGSPYPQSLILHGHGVGGTNGALRISGGNSNKVWAGAVTLATDSTIHVTGDSYMAVTVLTLTNTISGTGRFIKDGSGRLVFAGSTANTYSGGTWVRDGYFDLWKPSGVAAIPGDVVIGDGIAGKSPDLHLEDSHQIANGFDLTLTNGMFDPNANSESIGTLNGRGAVALSPGGILTVNPGSGVTCAFDGSIGSSGSVVKGGNGTLILSGTNTHTGNTTVNAGTLQVDGEIRSSPLTLNAGRLQGFGKVANVSPNNAGCFVTPGTSPGILTCSNFNASGAGSGILLFEMAGTTPGAGYDQLDVRGTVNLNGIVLAGALAFASSLSNQFVIIKNDGADAVVGTFTGWPQNSILTINGEQFRISYTGGTGNDVVLTQISGAFRPVLAIERIAPASVCLLWPTNNAAGFFLTSNTNLAVNSWPAVSPPRVLLGTNYVVTNSVNTTKRFYRLELL